MPARLDAGRRAAGLRIVAALSGSSGVSALLRRARTASGRAGRLRRRVVISDQVWSALVYDSRGTAGTGMAPGGLSF
jgi:hypothetical protein